MKHAYESHTDADECIRMHMVAYEYMMETYLANVHKCDDGYLCIQGPSAGGPTPRSPILPSRPSGFAGGPKPASPGLSAGRLGLLVSVAFCRSYA